MPDVPSPRLSAIVVAHGRPFATADCIDSVLAQSERALELVVVLNDASAAVEETVRARASGDPRMRVIRASASASEARNYGVNVARASILYFLDDDVQVPVNG